MRQKCKSATGNLHFCVAEKMRKVKAKFPRVLMVEFVGIWERERKKAKGVLQYIETTVVVRWRLQGKQKVIFLYYSSFPITPSVVSFNINAHILKNIE